MRRPHVMGRQDIGDLRFPQAGLAQQPISFSLMYPKIQYKIRRLECEAAALLPSVPLAQDNADGVYVYMYKLTVG